MPEPIDVPCSDCAAPAGTECHTSNPAVEGFHAERIRVAILQSVEHGTCALCTQPLVRGPRPPSTDITVWHPDPAHAEACPPMADPLADWNTYAAQVNSGLAPGVPGPENFITAEQLADAIEHVGGMDFNEVALALGPLPALIDPIQALSDAGYGTPQEVATRLAKALEDPITEPLATSYPRPLLCPECVNGKHVNCTGQALDPVTDDIVPCTCTHQEL